MYGMALSKRRHQRLSIAIAQNAGSRHRYNGRRINIWRRHAA